MLDRLLASDRLRRVGLVIVLLAAAGAAVVAARRLVWVDTVRHQEVIAYRISSQALADGVPVATFYDDEAFWKLTQERGLHSRNIFFPNPPIAAVLHLPFVGLDFVAARRAHLAVSAFAAILALGILCRALSLSLARAAVLWLVLFSLHPWWVDLTHGQVYSVGTLFLAGSFALGTRGTMRWSWLAGGLAAVPLVFKVYGAFVPLAAPRRGFRAFLLGHVATAIALILGLLPAVGLSPWREFLGPVRERVAGNPMLTVTAFQSLTGLVARLTTRDPEWNPRGLVDAPLLCSTLQVAVILALAATVLWLRRDDEPGLAFSAAVLVGLLVSPFSQDYSYVAVLVPCAFLLARCRSVSGAVLMGLGTALVAWDGASRVARFQDGFTAVLAYPKVLGALLLLGALMRERNRPRRSDGPLLAR